MNNHPIGIFDSGVGGTSIWSAIHKLLPLENTIYLADSKNAPYGEKSPMQIQKLSIEKTEKLLDLGAKIIVVACNTATTNAIAILREKFNIPFIGIEPALKPAVNATQTNTIGILATKGTLSSQLFHNAVKNYTNIHIIEQIGTGLVPLIETGDINGIEIQRLLSKYLKPMVNAKIDYLVLGCSHYPYLIPEIQKIIPSTIKIIDSGEAVARQTKRVLENTVGLSQDQKSKQLFYTNGNPDVLTKILQYKYPVSYLDF
jgi:glutamate racemase